MITNYLISVVIAFFVLAIMGYSSKQPGAVSFTKVLLNAFIWPLFLLELVAAFIGGAIKELRR